MYRVEFESLDQMLDALSVRSLVENDKTIQSIKQKQQEMNKKFDVEISDPTLSQTEILKLKIARANANSISNTVYRKRIVELLVQKFKNTFFFI